MPRVRQVIAEHSLTVFCCLSETGHVLCGRTDRTYGYIGNVNWTGIGFTSGKGKMDFDVDCFFGVISKNP